MKLRVLTSAIPALIKHLQTYKAETYQVVGRLRNSLDGKRKVTCLVDQFPDGFTTVFVHVPEPLPVESYLTVFSSNVETFRDIFHGNYHMFDWSKQRKLSAVQPAVAEVVEDVLARENIGCTRRGPYWLLDCSQEATTTDLIEAPIGFHLSTLRLEHAEEVTSAWELSAPGGEQLISFVLQNYMSVSLVTEGGELAGWFVEQPEGSQGMLYLHPKFRGRSLSRYLIEKLKHRMLAKGRPTFVFVHPDNKKSLELHKASGYAFSGIELEWVVTDPQVT